ncbi:uncharacterized protein LOC101848805 [Aplysia californica]|uniref:Uncharacterized protein LOC101848805 n=1 Tax=Aplysia californica TaxID=6500 RepID=A0ABM1VP97_APLCA|nr:uncharacterized protein LOC101848805 [Aplysia californica]
MDKKDVVKAFAATLEDEELENDYAPILRLEELGVFRGSGRTSMVQGTERRVINQMNMGTISRWTLRQQLSAQLNGKLAPVSLSCFVPLEDAKGHIEAVLHDVSPFQWRHLSVGETRESFRCCMMTMLSLLEAEEEVLPLPELKRWHLLPCKPVRGGDTMYILLDNKDCEEDSLTLKLQLEDGRLVIATKIADLLYQFEAPHCAQSTMKVTCLTNGGLEIGKDVMEFCDKMADITKQLDDVLNPLEFLVQSLQLQDGSHQELDARLADMFCSSQEKESGVWPERLHSLDGGFWNSKQELPTLLHFAAKFNLPGLCQVLLKIPWAGLAAGIANRERHTPEQLARKYGHVRLAELLVTGSKADSSSPSQEQEELYVTPDYCRPQDLFAYTVSSSNNSDYLDVDVELISSNQRFPSNIQLQETTQRGRAFFSKSFPPHCKTKSKRPPPTPHRSLPTYINIPPPNPLPSKVNSLLHRRLSHPADDSNTTYINPNNCRSEARPVAPPRKSSLSRHPPPTHKGWVSTSLPTGGVLVAQCTEPFPPQHFAHSPPSNQFVPRPCQSRHPNQPMPRRRFSLSSACQCPNPPSKISNSKSLSRLDVNAIGSDRGEDETVSSLCTSTTGPFSTALPAKSISLQNVSSEIQILPEDGTSPRKHNKPRHRSKSERTPFIDPASDTTAGKSPHRAIFNSFGNRQNLYRCPSLSEDHDVQYASLGWGSPINKTTRQLLDGQTLDENGTVREGKTMADFSRKNEEEDENSIYSQPIDLHFVESEESIYDYISSGDLTQDEDEESIYEDPDALWNTIQASKQQELKLLTCARLNSQEEKVIVDSPAPNRRRASEPSAITTTSTSLNPAAAATRPSAMPNHISPSITCKPPLLSKSFENPSKEIVSGATTNWTKTASSFSPVSSPSTVTSLQSNSATITITNPSKNFPLGFTMSKSTFMRTNRNSRNYVTKF